MRLKTLFTLETPYRDPLTIQAAVFGREGAEPLCALVGSMRGNEVQQTYIAARVVARLRALEEAGLTDPGKLVLVVPSVNAFSMNIHKRFWPLDNTDINRMFPGYSEGETTQRIADGLFRAVQDFPFGIQLASFYLRGRFLPHVRITDEGPLSRESLDWARLFGLPATLLREPSTFDTTTLNYNWQVWDTHAFSVFSRDTGSLDPASARQVEDGIVRFLAGIGAVRAQAMEELEGPASANGAWDADGVAAQELRITEESLVDVRAEASAGFFEPLVAPGAPVERGQVLARIHDTFDASVREELRAPIDGLVFFSRSAPLANQYSICFKLAPTDAR